MNEHFLIEGKGELAWGPFDATLGWVRLCGNRAIYDRV
jgi:hypothetical protein